MKGAPDFSPTDNDYIYFEHTLFAYLNKALASSRKIRISHVDVDKIESELQLKSDSEVHVTAFTVLTGAKSSRREEDSNAMEVEVVDDYEFSSEDERFAEQGSGDEISLEGSADYEVENIGTESIEELINEQEESDRDLQSSSRNLLVLKVDIEGRDYTNLRGHFKKHVKGAIDQGSAEVLSELVNGGDIGNKSSRQYFENMSEIRVTAMTDSESYSSSRSTGSGSSEPSSSGSSSRAKEEAEPSDGNPTPDIDKDKEKKKPRGRPMNAKAIEFRIISGSIFLSLCLTAVLSNTIRILSRKREERRRRMEKAKNAYEVPRKAMMSSRGTSEKKFVGMLDDGDHYK
eukprot:CAMPEP_0194085442 /NCGR_PEP_ID=MMETSP0149-20130528/17575_1 /TAXON_ID=122233 /ORGANISM="Chaetoceros debilis, Strain MM31A-1" /LENGTH=344 /DNA_ID=CAMNT_0038768331 /DNA_START=214 /DNA_END=1248 /DNA_ORIENTATION=+